MEHVVEDKNADEFSEKIDLQEVEIVSPDAYEEEEPEQQLIGWPRWMLNKTGFWGLFITNFVIQEMMIAYDNSLWVHFFTPEDKQALIDTTTEYYLATVAQMSQEYEENEETEVSPTAFAVCYLLAVPVALNFAMMLYHFMKHPYTKPGEEAHPPSIIGDFVKIGPPFVGILMGAGLEVCQVFNFPKWAQISFPPPIGVVGGFGNSITNSYFIHEAADESGGGFKGFLKGLIQAFIIKTFYNDKSVWGKFHLALIQLGIILGHIAEGTVGAQAVIEYLKLIGYNSLPYQVQLAISVTLGVFFAVALTAFEGLPEARCVHTQANSRSGIHWPGSITKLEDWENFIKSTPRIVVTSWKWYSAILHSLITVLGTAELLGPTTAGPWDGLLYNILIATGAAVVVGYGNMYGTFSSLDFAIERCIELDLPEWLSKIFKKDMYVEHGEIHIYDRNVQIRLPDCINNLRQRNKSDEGLPLLSGDAQRVSCLSGVFHQVKEKASDLVSLCSNPRAQLHEIPEPKDINDIPLTVFQQRFANT
jgi:hypothetical protein